MKGGVAGSGIFVAPGRTNGRRCVTCGRFLIDTRIMCYPCHDAADARDPAKREGRPWLRSAVAAHRPTD